MSRRNQRGSKAAQPDTVIWDTAVADARAAIETADKAQDHTNWIVGDAALSVATEYGENTLKRFANAIGKPAASVRQCRTISARYPASGDGAIARDLQHRTVYVIFASQDDAAGLITRGNEGQPWTVAAARELVQYRNEGVPVSAPATSPATPAGRLEAARTETARLKVKLRKQEDAVRKTAAELLEARAHEAELAEAAQREQRARLNLLVERRVAGKKLTKREMAELTAEITGDLLAVH